MHVVLVESNFSGVSAIEAGVKAGIRMTLLTRDFNYLIGLLPLGSESSLRLANEIVEVDTNDVEAMFSAIEKLSHKPDAVLTFSQPFTSITAQLAKRLNLKGASPEAVEIGRDKSHARKILRERGVDDTKVRVCSPSELQDAALSIGFPLVLKPNKGQGSLNVRICESLDDVLTYQANLSQAGPQTVSSEILVEEFLDGPLFSVESFTTAKGTHKIWGIADRVLTSNGVEVGASFPVDHSQSSEMFALACQSLDAIGYDFGPSHVEMILTSNGPKIVELNLRVGGSGMTQIMDRSLNRSVCLDILHHYCGQPVDEELVPSCAAAWYAAVTEDKWILKELPSQYSIDSWGMDAFWFHKKADAVVGGIDSNFSWIAQSMSSGPSHAEAMKKAESGVTLFLEACGRFVGHETNSEEG